MATVVVERARKIKKYKHATRKILKRDIFSYFTSITFQQQGIRVMSAAAEITSVCSEFEICAHKPTRTSVLGMIGIA